MIKRLWAVLVFALLAVSCQNDSVSENTEALSSDSALTAVLKSMAVNNTVGDDIIDNTSCYRVVLPVYVIVNGYVKDVNSEADFQYVADVLAQSPYDVDTISMMFPITVQNIDYQDIVVNSQEAFDALRVSCTVSEGYIGDDCVSFVFPLTVYTYNSGFQMQDTFQLRNNNELYTMLQLLGPNELYSVNYPVSLNVKDGAGVTANSNSELLDAINNALTGCQQGGCTNPKIIVNDLALYITFSNGTAKDLKGNTVIVPEDMAFTADREGNQNCAIVFNGTQFLQIPKNSENAIVQGQPYSVSLWFRMQDTNSSDVEVFFSKGDISGSGFQLLAKDLNTPVFSAGSAVELFDTNWKADAALPVDITNWHHLVVTVDSENNSKLYRDGALRNSQDSSAAQIGSEAMDYFIGSNFKGYLDDLRVYKKALSPQEVQTLFELEGDCNTCLE